MTRRLTLFFSAGERSGDMHGANLMSALRARAPQARFIGLGRERMRARGLEAIEDMAGHSVLWFDAAARIPRLFGLLSRCKAAFVRERPDAVVLIDYVGFNLFLAKAAHAAGIPVFYYIAPQLWAHGDYRALKLRKWVRRVLVIYPFEEAFYRKWGVPVTYVGHPLFDELAASEPRADAIAALRSKLGENAVALFSGSRGHEARRHGRLLIEAARRIRAGCPEARFVAQREAGAGPALWDAAAELDVVQVEASVPEIARAAAVCLVKSGTTTLEVAAAGCPMVVFYRVSPFAYFIGKGLRDAPFISLVNALAGRELVPERLMHRLESGWLADRALELLEPARRAAMARSLAELMIPYARPGASDRAAEAILSEL